MLSKFDLQQNSHALRQIILERQLVESENPVKPYSNHPTTINYQDIHGHTLLFYAVAMNDKEAVEDLINQGATEIVLHHALKFGHLSIAQSLLEKGESAYKIKLSKITDFACRAWFLTLIRKEIEAAIEELKVHKNWWAIDSQYKTLTYKQLPRRIVELGDENFLELLKLHYPDITTIIGKLCESGIQTPFFDEELKSLMLVAAANNSIPAIQWLLNNGATIHGSELCDTPLHKAAKYNCLNSLKFLIESGANINHQGKSKLTSLLTAALNGQNESIEYLLESGADALTQDTWGNNLLHCAYIKHNQALISMLVQHPMFDILSKAQNIYGLRPYDYADGSTEKITSNENTKQSIEINQEKVLRKIGYFMKSQYRDMNFYPKGGACNGLSFLRDLYARNGRMDYYVDTLQLLSSWDGTQNALERPFSAKLPQSKYYQNLGELFEQWINDIVWFLHLFEESHPFDEFSTITYRTQGNRKYQYSIIANDEDYPIILGKEGHDFINKEQFFETISILREKMVPGIRFEITGSRHATSGYLNAANEIDYSDPNFIQPIPVSSDARDFTNKVIDTKIIATNQGIPSKFQNGFTFFYYNQSTIEQKLLNHIAFEENELPKCKQDVEEYQNQSPNGYTHLHVAVLAGSIISLKQLIQLGYCELDSKNKRGQTALDMALSGDRQDLVDILREADSDKKMYLEISG